MYVTLLEGGGVCYVVGRRECMLRCWKEGSVCYVVGRRGVYVTLLEGGECMLRCQKEVNVCYVVRRR